MPVYVLDRDINDEYVVEGFLDDNAIATFARHGVNVKREKKVIKYCPIFTYPPNPEELADALIKLKASECSALKYDQPYGLISMSLRKRAVRLGIAEHKPGREGRELYLKMRQEGRPNDL